MVSGEIKHISIQLEDRYKDRINENYKSCISELVKHFSDKFNEKLNKKILESFKDKVFINTTHFNSFGLIEEKYKVDCEINLALDLDSAIDNMLENSIINVEEKEAKQ